MLGILVTLEGKALFCLRDTIHKGHFLAPPSLHPPVYLFMLTSPTWNRCLSCLLLDNGEKVFVVGGRGSMHLASILHPSSLSLEAYRASSFTAFLSYMCFCHGLFLSQSSPSISQEASAVFVLSFSSTVIDFDIFPLLFLGIWGKREVEKCL